MWRVDTGLSTCPARTLYNRNELRWSHTWPVHFGRCPSPCLRFSAAALVLSHGHPGCPNSLSIQHSLRVCCMPGVVCAGHGVEQGGQQPHPHGMHHLRGDTDTDCVTQTRIKCRVVLNRKEKQGATRESKGQGGGATNRLGD